MGDDCRSLETLSKAEETGCRQNDCVEEDSISGTCQNRGSSGQEQTDRFCHTQSWWVGNEVRLAEASTAWTRGWARPFNRQCAPARCGGTYPARLIACPANLCLVRAPSSLEGIPLSMSPIQHGFPKNLLRPRASEDLSSIQDPPIYHSPPDDSLLAVLSSSRLPETSTPVRTAFRLLFEASLEGLPS